MSSEAQSAVPVLLTEHVLIRRAPLPRQQELRAEFSAMASLLRQAGWEPRGGVGVSVASDMTLAQAFSRDPAPGMTDLVLDDIPRESQAFCIAAWVRNNLPVSGQETFAHALAEMEGQSGDALTQAERALGRAVFGLFAIEAAMAHAEKVLAHPAGEPAA